ncbi:hypothetical protein MJO28_016187, partial [Puccinia striiformis f. sp. tritici]
MIKIEPKSNQHYVKVQAILDTTEFIAEHCTHFDYRISYLLAIFGALQEELANELWIHLVSLSQTGPHISKDTSNQGH